MTRPFVILAVAVALDSCHVDPRAGMSLANPEPVGSLWQAPPPRPQVVVEVVRQEAPKPAPAAPKPEAPNPAAPTPEEKTVKSEPTPEELAAAKIRDETDDQRAHDEIAYENEYLRLKERLVPDELGKWLAIVDGRLLPCDSHGKPMPAVSMADCLVAADAVDEKALHRFVFRIGEEGDVLYADPSRTVRSVVGTALKALLGVTAGFDPRANELTWSREGKSHQFKFDHERFPILLSDPTGRQTMATSVADSAGFGGFVALESVNSVVLDGPRFEIPGRVLLRSGDGFQELRRTRIRVRIPELDVDVTVPAAAWPR